MVFGASWTAPGCGGIICAMKSHTRLLALLPLLLLAACGRGGQDGQAGAPVVAGEVPAQAQDSERTWAGLLPCRDCQGVDTRLVLRTDRGRRNYVMTETYVGGTGRNSFNRAGTWTEIQRKVGDEQQVTYVLDPDRAAQRFELQPDGALELLELDGQPPEDALAYRLQRL
jgi:copper homeostasis protein (lipoprotein)